MQSLELPSSPSVSTPDQKPPNKSCTQQMFIKRIVPNNYESLRNGPGLTLVSHEHLSARPSAKAPGFCCRCLCCIYLTDKSHLELSTVHTVPREYKTTTSLSTIEHLPSRAIHLSRNLLSQRRGNHNACECGSLGNGEEHGLCERWWIFVASA